MLSFQVKAVVLDPANEFNVDRTLTKEDVQKLIKVEITFLHKITNTHISRTDSKGNRTKSLTGLIAKGVRPRKKYSCLR